MRQLIRPTLVRRVFLSLLTACSLLWMLMMGANLYDNMGDEKTTEELIGVRNYLVDGLNGIQDEKVAAAFVQGAIGETHRDAYNWRNFRLIRYVLMDRSGRVILADRKWRPAPMDLQGAQVRSIEIGGQRFLLARGETERWSLDVALPLHNFMGIVRDDWLGMLLVVLIVFPFVFGAVWIAIVRGLQPLKQLSSTIAARGSDDLTPINVDPKFDELKPLVTALDSLLCQLRNKVSREHAFVQDAAHELRTPLAVISAQAHVLGKAETAGERHEAEQQMDQAIARAAHLIHQLLDLSKFDNHAVQGLARFDIAALVRQELAPLVPAFAQREQDLSLDTPDSLLAKIDRHAFLSVLHNLVDNAQRYVQVGGRVAVEMSSLDGVLRLSVADNGPGIPSEQAALVFERFHRVKHDGASGSGLGLAIARKAVARLNGEIALTAGLDGQGCRFTVQCPHDLVMGATENSDSLFDTGAKRDEKPRLPVSPPDAEFTSAL